VLVQVIDPLDEPPLGSTRQRHVVEHRQMLHKLAQAHAARVRAHRHSELGGEQQVGQVLVDTGHAAGVDLHHIDGTSLE